MRVNEREAWEACMPRLSGTVAPKTPLPVSGHVGSRKVSQVARRACHCAAPRAYDAGRCMRPCGAVGESR